MRRKLTLYLICGLLLIIGIGGAIIYVNTPTSGTLYVNGSGITSENVKIYGNYADLPFTEVLKGLGINVEWVDSSTAEFICNGQKYTLNLAEETLTKYGEDKDLLSIIAPGTTFVHQVVLEKELVLDSNTLLDNMYAMGNRLTISIDQQKSIVYLTGPEDLTGTLFINGKEITNVSAKISYVHSVLPFTEVLKGFGFNVTWRDNNIADITYEDKTYILNLEDTTLMEEGVDDDLLVCPPGGGFYYCKAEGREVFIDGNTIEGIMYDLGKKININFDRGKSIVYVTLRKD